MLSRSVVDAADLQPLQRVLLAYYRLLQANRTLPRTLGWPLAPLAQLISTPHPDKGVVSLAIRCYALHTGMMEGERVKLEQKAVGDVKDVDCPMQFGVNLDGSVRIIDGWVLPILEVERVSRARDALADVQDYYSNDQNSSIEPIHPAELRYVLSATSDSCRLTIPLALWSSISTVF